MHVDEHLHNFFKSSELDFLTHIQEIGCSIILMHREFGVTLLIIFFALLSLEIITEFILLGHWQIIFGTGFGIALQVFVL